MIRVLVVDDSAFVRRALTDEMSACDDIQVIGTAADPFIAREKILSLRPDVITMDVEMPGTDGMVFLSRIMKHCPTPVVVVSSSVLEGTDEAARALELGAVGIVRKPGSFLSSCDSLGTIVRAVRSAGSRAECAH
jgi:two-component system, chemotaxis family, protein-glutamate methylesterase/glutaminase